MYAIPLKKFNSILLLNAIFLALFSSYAVAETIVKWVDENGKTHYGDSIPDKYANRKNTVITMQGVTIKHNEAVDYQSLERKNARVKQHQGQVNKDRALLNSYTSAAEIDLAYQRTVDIDNASIQGLELNKRLAAGRLMITQKKIAAMQMNKEPLPPFVNKELVDHYASFRRTIKTIEQKRQEMVATKLKFEADAARYKALKSADRSH